MDFKTFIDFTNNIRSNIVNKESGVKKYALISNFKNTSMEDLSKEFVDECFRLFTPVKPEEKRKLNSCFGSDFNIFEDSLFDYPSIAQNKLGGNWEDYNRLASIHVAYCNLGCWYCYVDECLKTSCHNCLFENSEECDGLSKTNRLKSYFTASEIVELFIKQFEKDKEITLNEKNRTILRITGGEPFLAPDFILDVLKEIKKKNMENEIYVWTETNITPFLISDSDGNRFVENWQNEDKDNEFHWSLNELSDYRNNFCVHPCFHGLSKDSFLRQTGIELNSFEDIMEAFNYIMDLKIDIYPTFSINVCSPQEIIEFFNRITQDEKRAKIALRFALIDYSFRYSAIQKRFEKITDNLDKLNINYCNLYNKYISISIWNKLLKDKFGISYAEIPRNFIIV